LRSGAGLFERLNELGREGIDHLSQETDRLVRLSGANFRVLENNLGRARPWQLAATPLTLAADQWKTIEQGLSQRIRLLEAVANDLLGSQNLIRHRVIPAELLFGNPVYSRSYHQLPSSGPRLTLTATDLARSVDGQWMVTADRTRAPSGLGYALENRVIMARIYPEWIRQENVTRLAPFFIALQRHLKSLVPDQSNPRIAILTPEQHSYRYVEDAYLAKYLNYTLVQGVDLAVRDGRLNLKTLGGLVPIDVLCRHISDLQCDPLELNSASLQGVTGLMTLIRQKRVAVTNSIGSEIVQTPALMPFLPSISQFLFAEDLLLPSLPTYWCGQPNELKYVLNHLDDLDFRPAFNVTGDRPVNPSALSAQDRQKFIDRLKDKPMNFVAACRPQRSTTAVWHDGQMRPWHVAVRTFQLQTFVEGTPDSRSASDTMKISAAQDTEVLVMPGALTRVSPDASPLDYSPVSGRLGLDTWIVNEELVDTQVTLLIGDDQPIVLKRSGAELPSRVAESFFWLARGAERTEMIARLIRATLTGISSDSARSDSEHLNRMVAALAVMGQIPPDYAVPDFRFNLPPIEKALPLSVFDTAQTFGIRNSVRDLVERVVSVNDRISVETYRILTSIADHLEIDPSDTDPDLATVIERLDRVIIGLLAFSGLIHEVVTRTHGWRFLEMGRRIERAYQMAELIQETLVKPIHPERPMLETLLHATDSIMTYRSRYLMQLDPVAVLDLLVCDTTNPRSIAFQIESIDAVIHQLPSIQAGSGSAVDGGLLKEIRKRVIGTDLRSLAGVSKESGRNELKSLTTYLLATLPKLSDLISARYLVHSGRTQELTGRELSESALDDH
jgi:uncharacterized circularly permuted ATP-grasp superfamily protein/uncharacterized alpha-E superfamily protein